MVAKTNKRSVKKVVELSKIFGDLPDMLKQQVLEFAAPTKDPFFLGYSPKTNTFVKQVNKSFMKEMLEYKINNPPVEYMTGDINVLSITPQKIPRYELCYNNGNINVGDWSYMIFVDNKYMKLTINLNRKCRKTNKKIMGKHYINGIQIFFTL